MRYISEVIERRVQGSQKGVPSAVATMSVGS